MWLKISENRLCSNCDIPSGCLPLEEYLLERSLPLEADETFTVNGRSWLTLK